MRMGIKKVPRAAFRLEPPPRRGRQELAGMLQQHLCQQFGRVQIVWPFVQMLLRRSILRLRVQGKGIVVLLERSKIPIDVPEDKRAWRLMIDPFESSMPLKRMLMLEREYEKELMVVSEDLHAFLVSTPGMKSLCWYFRGWDPKLPGAPSPAELPWHEPISTSE